MNNKNFDVVNTPDEKAGDIDTENEYEGFGLFNDIAEDELRTRNRAVSMYNIYDLHSDDEGNMNDKGRGLMHGYFGHVPEEERSVVFVAFLEILRRHGVIIDPVEVAGV